MSTQPETAELLPPEQPTTALAVQEPRTVALTQPNAPAAAPITAAQAKVDAIAHLTMQAYDKAATLEITPEESAKLQEEFPDEAFKPGAAGKEHLIYIEHAYLRDRFNAVFGMGRWAIVPRNRWNESFKTHKGTPGERVYVEAMLVVRGCFVGEAVGAMEYYPHNESQNYGDAVEGAKTAAFRRCAKEFGVGLQAWKKDFCDGWWQRQRAAARTAQPRATQAPARPHNPAPTSPATKPQAPAPPSAPSNAVADAAKPTERTLEWFKNEMKQFGDIARDFFRETGVLMPNEEMADYPLHRCPTSRHTVDTLKQQIQEFHAQRTGRGPAKPPIEVPREDPGQAPEGFEEPPCFKVIVPIPRKGQKRADYILQPDTIGSLYHAMKNGDEEAKRRLWGFANNYQPEGWTKRDGTEMPPSQTDIDFRAALDQFLEWHEAHRDEQDTGNVP